MWNYISVFRGALRSNLRMGFLAPVLSFSKWCAQAWAWSSLLPNHEPFYLLFVCQLLTDYCLVRAHRGISLQLETPMHEKNQNEKSYLLAYFSQCTAQGVLALVGWRKLGLFQVYLLSLLSEEDCLHFWYSDMTWCCRWMPSTCDDQGTPRGSGCTGNRHSWDAHTTPSNHSPPWWSCSGWSKSAGRSCPCCTQRFGLGNSHPHKTQSGGKETKSPNIARIAHSPWSWKDLKQHVLLTFPIFADIASHAAAAVLRFISKCRMCRRAKAIMM